MYNVLKRFTKLGKYLLLKQSKGQWILLRRWKIKQEHIVHNNIESSIL